MIKIRNSDMEAHEEHIHEIRMYISSFRERHCPCGDEPLARPMLAVEGQLRQLENKCIDWIREATR